MNLLVWVEIQDALPVRTYTSETRFLGIAINPAYMFDFPKQDVVADTYTFRKIRGHESVGSSNSELASEGAIRYHKVKRGDTLSRIAAKEACQSTDFAS